MSSSNNQRKLVRAKNNLRPKAMVSNAGKIRHSDSFLGPILIICTGAALLYVVFYLLLCWR